MAIAQKIAKVRSTKVAIRQAIEDMGVEMPKNACFREYPDYIGQIKTGPDPNNPTLANLKLALATDNPAAIYPVGTEIPDKYAGNDNPLIVAQYLNSSNNSAYDGAEGAICIRKYVEPTSQIFDYSNSYPKSQIKSFLDTTYLNNCSDALKSVIAEVNIPCNNTTVKSKMFLMSDREVCSNAYSTVEGEMWDLWKQRTGLSSPNSGTNNGRIMRDRSSTARGVWLRSYSNALSVYAVSTVGNVVGINPSSGNGVLPACFIGKN